LRRALSSIESAQAAGSDGVVEDLAFHRAIGQATGNPQFSRLLTFLEQYLGEAMRVIKGHEAQRADFMAQVHAEHQAIFEAVAARNAAAAREAALAHLRHGEARLQESLLGARRRAAALPRTRREPTPVATRKPRR
jgi:GntR family transcriptional repressor for pyruvate dehydrogenase complex